MPQKSCLPFRPRKGPNSGEPGDPRVGTKSILLKKQPPGRRKFTWALAFWKLCSHQTLYNWGCSLSKGLGRADSLWGFRLRGQQPRIKEGPERSPQVAARVTCYTSGPRRQPGLLAVLLASIHALAITFSSAPRSKGRSPRISTPAGTFQPLKLSRKPWAYKTSCVSGIPRTLKLTERQFPKRVTET